MADEFGRDDPETEERERRRAERQQRRVGSGAKKRRAPQKRAPAPRQAQPGQQRPQGPRQARQQQQPRPTPRRGGPTGTYRRRQVIALGGVVVGLLLIWFLVALFQPFAGDGSGKGSVTVTIPEGADAGKVADILKEKKVIDNGTLFQIRLRLAGKSNDIQADDYSMAVGMSYGAAIDRLTGSTTGLKTLTIPEGLSRPQIAKLAADAGVAGDYEAASVSSPGFDPAQYGAKKAASLEGFLFPATYDLADAATAQQLVQLQLNAFQQKIKGVDMSYAKKKNLTVYDVVAIASMIEREVMIPKERPLVAAVIYNRLHKGQPLGIDATTRFETGNYDQPLTSQQLQTDSPYNTRTRAGLPPGPIGNPGLDAIKAAAHPANVRYLFYVVKPNTCGEHTFVRTEAEFQAAVAAYNAAREKAGGNAPTEC